MAVDVVAIGVVVVLVVVVCSDRLVLQPALDLDAFGLRVEEAEAEQFARIDRAVLDAE